MEIATRGWNAGEEAMHKMLHAPSEFDNPTRSGLSFHAQILLQSSSLLALGIVDEDGRPWTTLLGGGMGFARSLGQSIIGVKTVAGFNHDPVLQHILKRHRGNDDQGTSDGQDHAEFSALGIHLASRNRVKLQGKLLGAAVASGDERKGELQMALAVTGSLGNCPKYLNEKDIILSVPEPVLVSDKLPLPPAALTHISKADLFFITSYQPQSMSTNHRGGLPGFIRVLKNDKDGCVLVYPEYSGNRLYQTLGNLILDSRAGVMIPDFEAGNALYLTCKTKIVHGQEAAKILPRSNLVVELHVTSAILVERGLAFRAKPGESSPYNPPIRYLATEKPPRSQDESPDVSATLLSRDLLTPTIARFRFQLSKPKLWKAGQYVALSFDSELNDGYAHMNDEDPRALNDDFVRTFTVSSPPPDHENEPLGSEEFELTIRKVGKATNFLFKTNVRAGLEVPVLGFEGDFVITQGQNQVVPFIAAGVGITPLLSQLQSLNLSNLRLFWTVNSKDLGLVTDVVRKHPQLAENTSIFITGNYEKHQTAVQKLENEGARILKRRLRQADLTHPLDLGDKWYICTGPSLRRNILEWLDTRQVIYEDFGY